MPADPPDSLPLLVTAGEFARQLSVCRRTFDQLVSTGALPQADVRLSRKLVRWKAATVREAVEVLARGHDLAEAH